ncbi:hypothetical protein [Kitasatospora sp. NPDC086791]|uniref:hypothetical protein n=1 Tax=Kitasatospora sp. NPDC086791 TaxID=3155178 RepID=UPI00342E8758
MKVGEGESSEEGRWIVPDSLRGPVRQVPTNLAIQMLSCELLDHEIKALLGEFIAEASRCHLRPMEAPMNFDRQARFGGVLREATRIVYEGWEDFRAAIESGGRSEDVREAIQESRDSLFSRLQSANERLRGLPGSVI